MGIFRWERHEKLADGPSLLGRALRYNRWCQKVMTAEAVSDIFK